MSTWTTGLRSRVPDAQAIRRLGRELAWVGVGQAAAVAGTVVGLRVLTGALGPREFGRLALALTVSSLLGLTVFAGPGAATLRFFGAARESGELILLIRAAQRSIWRRAAWVVAVTVVAVAVLLVRGQPALSLVVTAAVLQALFTSFSTVLDGAQNAARQRSIVALHAALSQWLRWIVALALFPLLGRTGGVALWGYTIGTGLVFLSQYWFFRGLMRNDLTSGNSTDSALVESWGTRVDTYGRPYSFWGLPSWLHNSSERWALERFSSVQSVGLYAVLSQLGFGMTTLLSNAVMQLLSPLVFHRAGDGSSVRRMQDIHRMNVTMVLSFLGLTTLMTLVTAALHRVIFTAFVSSSFHSVSWLLPFGVLSGGLYACGQLAGFSVMSGTSNARLVAPKIGTAVIGVVSTIIGASRAGVTGVVAANLLASTCYCAWVCLIAWQERQRTDALLAPSSPAAPMVAP
jgi:O-antigen/teichoic acid export membrane protein